MLILVLGGTAISIWTTNRAAYYNDRIMLAHASYEAHLKLANATYRLFKQYGDRILIGGEGRTFERAVLIQEIRGNITEIRQIIGEEIDLVGEEEIDELATLALLETKINGLIVKFKQITSQGAPEVLAQNWSGLSLILDNEIDRDFQSLIEAALAEELEETEETRLAAKTHEKFANRLAISFALLAITFTGFALWSYRSRIQRPLHQLMSGVEMFSAGHFNKVIGLKGRDEIAQVATVLDDMAAQVEERTRSLESQNAKLEDAVRSRTVELERLLEDAQTAETNRRRLMADVSHELRTPLTIIQGETEVALRGAEKTAEEYQEALRRARDTAKHTNRLVDDLLFIARREAGVAKLDLQEVDLASLMTETLSMVAPSIPFVTTINNAPTRVDPMRIRQCIIALLQNARRYGGDQIEARLDATQDGFVLSVADHGPGMSDAEKQQAFSRFFRGSNAAEDYAEGTGLGLPVVKSIAEAHGGSVALADAEGSGLVVSIHLPGRPRLQAVS
ncbi:hypothetical protein CFI11_05665 [Thalassococcus sp. S3]|nr:hypothetical protein CFI11_05665 [Thalassococcus sp. S3]